MRRSLDPKTRTYSWVPEEWSQCSNSCGPGQQTRAVQCVMNGKLGSPEVNCGPSKPDEVQACYDIQGCSYTWQPGEWSDVQGCGEVVQTRELTCLRGDGETVSNDQCPAPAPDTTKTVRDLRTCSYSWKAEDYGEWSDYCRTGAERSRDVYCLRSNGERAEDGFCSAAGSKPDATETSNRYEQCGYTWEEKAWGDWSSACQTNATRQREVVCRRSNGDEVADSMCAAAGAKPAVSETEDRYEGCSYSWRIQEWGAVTPACGQSARSRTVECLRSNGDVVADGSCDVSQKPADTEPATNYETCTYDWSEGAWGAPSTTCGSATSGRSVTCLSSDGRTVTDSFCATAKPPVSKTTYETSGCSYAWRNDEWGAPAAACGVSTQNRSVWCLRSDGQTVADASCPSDSRPAAVQGATDYSTCTYGWNPGAWSAPSSTCGQASYTRPVTCLSSDGRTVADSFCSGQKPDTSKSDYVTSGCSYSWNASATWSSPVPACGPTVQNRAVTCLRSDGQTVADGLCDAGARPASQQGATDYSTCTYGWTATSWGAWSTACGQAAQTRAVTCQSSDGRTVADGFCAGGAKPAESQSAYQTSGCGYTWQTSAFGAPAPACGATTQIRTVWCLRSDGQTVEDGLCGAGKPAVQQAATDYGTCSYSWNSGGWSAPSSTCGAATQTRSVSCLRSDGTTVADASCAAAGAKPATSQTSLQTGSCSYARVNPTSWGGWDNACSGSAHRTRTYQCQRSDGAIVDGGECTNRGISLSETETGANYTNACPGYFAVGGWTDYNSHCSASATRTRDVGCYRSGDNVFAGDQYCIDRGMAVPARSETTGVYDGCGYNWQANGWSAPAPACGASTQTRTVWCQRSDGTTVADAYCNGGTRPAAAQAATDYQTCSYGWNATNWGAWSTTCGQGTQTRSVWCQRSDGTTVADAVCGASKPPTSQSAYQVSGCGYSWQAGGWGAPAAACGASTQTRAVWCQRSDGATVDGGLCGAGQPASSQGTTDYSACSYGWAYSGWGTVSHTCGNVTQNRSVWCQRSDGQSVAEGYCGGGKPAASQAWADYSVCTYSAVNPGGWSGWNSTCSANAYRSRRYQCQRADGAIVADGECTNRGVGLDEGQGAAVYDGCSYAVSSWGAFTPANLCSANTTATRYATGCQRSDGTPVAIAECSNRGIPTSQTVQTSNFAGCGYSWQAGGWSAEQAVCTTGTQTRDVWCLRSDGARVDDGACGAGRPAGAQNYSNALACGYTASYGPWSPCQSNNQRTQSMTLCMRSDGTSVAGEECVNRGQPWTRAEACTTGYGPGIQITSRPLYYTCTSGAPYYYGCTYIGGYGYMTEASCTGTQAAAQCLSGSARFTPINRGTLNGQCSLQCQ
ncbi:thrombospondin type-1 domain-containing protein [Sphingomonas sp. 3-13AW]|uniref:thrombospondin type-1 domain-containing protein n=1 Tax=Sphingomonas sp. 3-13AW TaxID=3050450 RepID=UPI003BB5AD33